MKVSVKVQVQHISSSLLVTRSCFCCCLASASESGPLREQWMKFVKKTQYEIEKSERRFPQPVGAVQWHVNDHSSSHTMLKFHIWRRARRISLSWLAEREAEWKKEREIQHLNYHALCHDSSPLSYNCAQNNLIVLCCVFERARRRVWASLWFILSWVWRGAVFIYLWLSWFNKMDRELRKRTASRVWERHRATFILLTCACTSPQPEQKLRFDCKINEFNYCENMNSNGVIYHQVSSGV